MYAKPFETAEQALHWAVECSNFRDNPRASGTFDFGLNRPCEIVDVFNSFQSAYRKKLITRQQYTLFLYAKKYGDLPPESCLYHQWGKMICIVEPLLVEKGIVVKI